MIIKDNEPYLRRDELLIRNVELRMDRDRYIFSVSAYRRKREHYRFDVCYIKIPPTIQKKSQGIRPEIYEQVMRDNSRDIVDILMSAKAHLEKNPRTQMSGEETLKDHPQIQGIKAYVERLYEEMREKQYIIDETITAETEESPAKRLLCIDVT